MKKDNQEIPKRADKAIKLLDGLIEQLHYFYQDDRRFKKEVLKDAIEIESILKELAVNKKETFKRIAGKYKRYYENKNDSVIDSVNDSKLNESIKQRYKSDIKRD